MQRRVTELIKVVKDYSYMEILKNIDELRNMEFLIIQGIFL